MSFMRSVPHGRCTLLARERVAREAIEAESADERMGGIVRDGMAHGLAANRRRLEAPGAPPCVEIETAHGCESHDGSKVRGHVGHAGPLTVDLDVRQEGKELEHVRGERLDE